MNDREVSELRRHLRPERHSISAVYGCYVTGSGEQRERFQFSMGELSQDEQENYLNLLKKTLSGSMNRSLTDVVFSTKQVADSDEHRLLMRLRDSELKDEAARGELFDKISATVRMEDNYLILCACDRYDVPRRAKDDFTLEDSEEVFTYYLCCICPVKQGKTRLNHDPELGGFRFQPGLWSAAAPQLGFVFPAFDGRRSNIYSALYYCRDQKDCYAELVEQLFHTTAPMPVLEQRQTFASLLSHTLEEECSLSLVQTVQEQLGDLMEAHRQSKEPEPLTMSARQVESLLKSCGVSESHSEKFAKECDDAFGEGAVLSPRNLVESRMQLRTPDVVINVSAGRSDLLQTRTIGGVNYILICADEGVEVNGIDIRFPEKQE